MSQKFVERLEEYGNWRKILCTIMAVIIIGSIVIGCIAVIVIKNITPNVNSSFNQENVSKIDEEENEDYSYSYDLYSADKLSLPVFYILQTQKF